MKMLLAALMLSFVGVSAMAEVYVPYNQWTYLPHCGGSTRLDCPNIRNANKLIVAKSSSAIAIAVTASNLCVGQDYHPTWGTAELSMKGSFYVDYSKINSWGRDSFKVYMYSTFSDRYEQVHYQFNY